MVYVVDQFLLMDTWSQKHEVRRLKIRQRDVKLAKIGGLDDWKDCCLERRELRTKMVLESLIKAG